MGMSYDWECTAAGCNHLVEEVSGGRDSGFYIRTETRVCKVCRKVLDYVIDTTEGPLGSPAPNAHEYVNVHRGCSVCGGETVPWDRTCPECGAAMRQAKGGMISNWD